MANITLSETPGSPISGFDKTKLIPNTSTAFITPEYSGTAKAIGPADAPNNYNIGDLDTIGAGDRKSERGFLRGRRPYFGLLFPRGYYNR